MPLPTTTRAAVLTAPHELDIREVRLPDTIEPGAMLVEIVCASLCGTDVEVLHGTMPTVTPMIMGHEMLGRALAVGDGAVDALGRPIEVGARVGWSLATCGHCHACAVLREPDLCENRGYEFLQSTEQHPYAVGGLSEYAYLAPGAATLLIDDSMPDTWASAAMCMGKTVTRAFDRTGGIRPGSHVVVQGAGALGLFATALASVSGAGRVITIGGPQARLDLARDFGATDTIGLDTEAADRLARVRELTGGRGADHVFDFAGAPGVVAEGIDFAATRGTVTIVGTTSPAPSAVGLSTIMGKELTVVGSVNGDIADYVQALTILDRFRDRVPWDRLFAPARPLTDAADAIEAMARLETVKGVIDPRMETTR